LCCVLSQPSLCLGFSSRASLIRNTGTKNYFVSLRVPRQEHINSYPGRATASSARVFSRYLANELLVPQKPTTCVAARVAVADREMPTDEESSKQGFSRIATKMKPWLVTTAMAGLTVSLWARRGSLSTDALNFLWKTQVRRKSIVKVVALFFLSTAIVSNVKTRRRQSKDATSEWQRYSEKPGARGSAIMMLAMKQSLFVAAARIATALDGFGSKKSNNNESVARSIRQYAGRKFSNGLLKLGPLYIKLGQIVSCRPGLLGKEWVDSLEDLQDRVPARTGQDAMDLAYSALDGGKEEFDRMFVDFESTPLAAASLGQVHRAKLRENGNEVAIKVQRPHLKKIYDQDFALLTTIAKWMDKLSKSGKNIGGVESSWTQIFSDAESILYREIDYRDEADNAMRFANDFGVTIGGNGNATTTALARNNQSMPDAAEWLRTPYIYANLSNERLLVQEYVPSIKITDKAKLRAVNITEVDRIKLADDLARAYLRQFCCHLFFSTDPHPGNLGVEMVPTTRYAGSEVSSPTMKPRLVMYDFGQAATLSKSQADGILEIIEAIIDMDVDRSIEAFQKMEVLVDGADLDQVRSKVADNYRTGKIKANRKKLRQKGFKFRDEDGNTESNGSANELTPSNTTKAEEYSESQVMSYFTLPAEYAFVARAISQMDGVGKSLDPEFDFISSAAPFIVEIKGTDLYLKDEVAKFIRSCQDRINTCCGELKKKTESFRP